LVVSSQTIRRWAQYVLSETPLPTSQITRSHNPKDYNVESYYPVFSMHCITTLFITNLMHALGYKYTLIFYEWAI
jgi:hypothetical protein